MSVCHGVSRLITQPCMKNALSGAVTESLLRDRKLLIWRSSTKNLFSSLIWTAKPSSMMLGGHVAV